MLDFLRHSVRSWPVKLLFGLLIISFAGWGIGDMLQRTGGAGAAVTVGQVKYQQRQVRQAFYRRMQRLAPMIEGDLTPDRAREMGLMQDAVQGLVRNALLSQEAARLGLAVTDARLRRAIKANPAFQDDQGNFDRRAFQQRLQQSGMSKQQYYERRRRGMQRRMLRQSVTAGARVPRTETEALYRVRNEKRVAGTALVPAAAMQAPTPREQQLRDWYAAHEDAFMAPEYREVTAVVLTAGKLARKMKVSDDQLRKAYDRRTGQYKVPAQRRVRQALFDSEEAAARVGKALGPGTSLKAAVEKAGADTRVRDMGPVKREDLPDSLAGPVFDAEAGDVAGPVKTRLGWHLVKVTEVVPAHARPFQAVRDELKQDLRMEKARDALYDLATRLEDTLAGGATLEEAAKKLDARLVKVDAVDSKGRDRQGDPVAGLPDTEKFLDTAFTIEPGMPSFLKDYDGGYFILRVDSVTPPAPRPFAQVRDTVARKWKAAKRREKARARAEELMTRVKAGNALAQAAENAGYEARTTAPFTRDPEGTPLPEKLVKAVFNMDSPGTATMAPVEDGFRVVTLKRIERADPEANKQVVQRLGRRLTRQVRRDIRKGLVESLKRDFPVKIKRESLKPSGAQS